MRVFPETHNSRRCNCADCKKALEKGEGIQYQYPMFHGNGQFFYLCPEDDQKRVNAHKEEINNLKKERGITGSLIPKNIMDEYKRRMQGSHGNDAKRKDARNFVYTTTAARFGAPWWNLNREIILDELEVAERLITARDDPANEVGERQAGS